MGLKKGGGQFEVNVCRPMTFKHVRMLIRMRAYVCAFILICARVCFYVCICMSHFLILSTPLHEYCPMADGDIVSCQLSTVDHSTAEL